jgi:uncharacterized membrane protein
MESTAAGAARPALRAWRVALEIFQGALFLAYPFIVYFGYRRLETRGVGILLLGLIALSLALRIRGPAAEIWRLVRQHLGLVLVIGLAILTGERRVLLLLPMLVSLLLLATFGWSLRSGPPLVERFARLVDPDLPDFCVPYCRKVTITWCAFLAANALCVALLALAGPFEWWALYTGLVFYLLMGALFAGEFILRKLWFRFYRDGLADRILVRVFPPERTANGRRSLAYVERRRERAATAPNAGRSATC